MLLRGRDESRLQIFAGMTGWTVYFQCGPEVTIPRFRKNFFARARQGIDYVWSRGDFKFAVDVFVFHYKFAFDPAKAFRFSFELGNFETIAGPAIMKSQNVDLRLFKRRVTRHDCDFLERLNIVNHGARKL